MRAFIIFTLIFCLYTYAKPLGQRTAYNFPKPWILGSLAKSDDPIKFIIALPQQNLDILEEKFWSISNPDSPDYRQFLTISEINEIIAPQEEVVQKVKKWLHDAGVSNIENRVDSLLVKTNVEVAAKLFNTDFYYFHHPHTGKTLVRQFGEYSIPKDLDLHVEFISGLSEFPVHRLTLIPSPEVSVNIAPQSVSLIYSIPQGTQIVNKSSAGVIEFDDQNYEPSQLQKFATLFNQKITTPSAEHTIGVNDPKNPQDEATLDIEWLLGVAEGAEGWFWIEKDDLWLYGFATHFFATQDVPLIVSISYGWNEEDQCEENIGKVECTQLGVNSTGYVTRVNTEFMKIGLRGISLFSASGDSGANGRTDPDCTEKHLNPPFPGASPYITAVGATMITDASGKADLPSPPPGCSGQDCASGGEEVCVDYDQANFASGGGFSVVAERPSYQSAAVDAYLKSGVKLPPTSYYHETGRGFPDVAALGSAILIYDGDVDSVGGTSASAPMFAGIITILNDYVISKTGKPLGFLNPFLYKMAAEHPSAFKDITKGDNICTESGCNTNCKGFVATNGWDPVSGLGTPVFTEMLAYVKLLFSIRD